MFLTHFDTKLYEQAKKNILAELDKDIALKLCSCFPGIATTLEQITIKSHKEKTEPQMDMVQLFDDYFSGDKRNNSSNFDTIHAVKALFQGTCHACRRKNHHANDCWFLQKVKMYLQYLKFDPKIKEISKTRF